MKIAYSDLTNIRDEKTLIIFLKEKLHLLIPDDLNIKDISSKLSNYA